MNTNITIISSEEEDFNLENIKPLDLQELAKEALELNHEVHVSTFHDDKFGFGTVVITPNRAGICWNGNSVFGDWITPSNGEGYLLTEDGDKYDINGNHLGNEELSVR